jgi:hypothetical protein
VTRSYSFTILRFYCVPYKMNDASLSLAYTSPSTRGAEMFGLGPATVPANYSIANQRDSAKFQHVPLAVPHAARAQDFQGITKRKRQSHCLVSMVMPDSVKMTSVVPSVNVCQRERRQIHSSKHNGTSSVALFDCLIFHHH